MRLTNGVDLERSFGPIYTGGLMWRGQSVFAVLGVNEKETQSSIDAALTFGILWLHASRNSRSAEQNSARASELTGWVEGLHLFVPAGCSALVRERMANLNAEAAKWRLFEFSEREDFVTEIDCSDRGNVATRLVHTPESGQPRTVRGIAPENPPPPAKL